MPLITPEQLAARLGADDLVIADVRWTLAGGPDHEAYAAGHIPGAHFVDLDRDLSAQPGPGRAGRHPLPSLTQARTLLQRLGVRAGSTVVAYDAVGGAIAARLWWLLEYWGHTGARVLDGGWPAWSAQQRPVGSAAADANASSHSIFEPTPDGRMCIDGEAIAAQLPHNSLLLLDARAGVRYRGEHEPIDPRAGHIPSARSAPFADNLKHPGGAFLDAAALRARFVSLGVEQTQGSAQQQTVHYCGSGVTACHNILAMRIAGLPAARLYPGSWSDWSSTPERPLASGPEAAVLEDGG